MTAIDPSRAEIFECVTLVAGGQSFGIDICQIREIRRWSPITALPHAPTEVLGVINLRGAVVPILDLAARLGLGTTEASGRKVFIIARIDQRIVGLLVDSVSEIIGIHRDQVRDVPPGVFHGVECLQGLIESADDMIRVIDLPALMPHATLPVSA